MSLEGQQIHRYRILRLLGSGGMGDVYLAEDARIEQQVAIKVIRAETSPYPDTQASQEAARLFQREARAIVKLDHPHILPLYDYGEERLGNMTIIYLVMPYRAEGSLSDWLRQRGRAGLLAPQDVAHIVGQAADALQHAHDRQIIHQDVKPSNFLLRHRQGTPTRPDLPDLFLADFGIAKFTTATSGMSHTIRGTPAYMAPEQWESQPVPATDQYALAVMAYELLTGRSPFQGGERQVMYQHLMVPPTPPSTLNPRLSKDIDTVLLHALAKKPEERFASITAFANAFQQAAQAMPAAPPTPAPAPEPANPGDIRAVLAISTAEAQAGTTRTLTLPGGRQVTVNVPAGVRDGQIVRLDGQGETSPGGGPSGALILSILVKTAEEPPSFSTASAAVAENTVLTANPAAPATSVPTVGNTGQQPSVSSTARVEMTTPPNSLVGSTQAAISASQVSFPTTRQALPVRPSVEWSDDRSSQVSGPVTAQPAQRGISRRTVVVGLAGLVVVGIAGGSLLWLTRSQQPAAPTAQVSPTIPLTSASSPSSLSIGTILNTYRGHSNFVDAVAWSPDGKRIASGSWDKTVQVWDAADGRHVITYMGHSDIVWSVTWAPDGKHIASGGGDHDTTVQVWDATTGANVFTYHGHSRLVQTVAWSPDGRHIASVSYDTTVQVWDATTGANIFTYRGHSDRVFAVAWSPDSTRIVSGSGDNTVQVWDATTGANVFTYHGHSRLVLAVAWSPDGKRIASGGFDHTVQVWNATDGGNVYTYRGHSNSQNGVYSVAWSPDGRRIASGSDDQTAQVWNATDGGNVYTYREHSNWVYSVAWSPDGQRIASGSADKTVQVWVAG